MAREPGALTSHRNLLGFRITCFPHPPGRQSQSPEFHKIPWGIPPPSQVGEAWLRGKPCLCRNSVKKECFNFSHTLRSVFSLALSERSFASSILVVELLSYVRLFATPQTAAYQASLFFPISQSLLKLISIASTISSSVVPFSSCLQSFPASRSFPVSQLFVSGGQSIGASVSASVLL